MLARLSLLLTAATVPALLAGTAAAADRLVTVGGSVTEIVYALGAGDSIVAADSTSVHPAETADLPKVGYLRQLAAEPIIALEPDLILASSDAGPPVVIDQIASAGVPIVTVPEATDPDGVANKIRVVAAALDREAEGEALAGEVEQGFETLASDLGASEERPAVLYLLAFANGAPMAAGSGTAADGIIALAGGSNAITDYEGYKPLSPEAAASLDPALVVVADHAVGMAGGLEEMRARADLGVIPAVRDGRVLVMDAAYLLGFGPRAAQAARELASHLHPDLIAAVP